ncbi:Arc family DNA-binding protein [Limimaricola cinnabarinus]|uniref:Arc family DNA-binding protein n=1 Tax=Limimaricola cinnabarinus TaxID=1125964 RepID=UPI002FE35168
MTPKKPMQLRLPEDLKTWLEKQADRNGSSQNSEVIRAIRERAARLASERNLSA